MKRALYLITLLLAGASGVSAQNSPYALFGDSTSLLTTSYGISHTSGNAKVLVAYGKVTYTDSMGHILFTRNLKPWENLRWLSVDPLSDQFPSWSPYNFVSNNPIRMIDPTGLAPKEYDVDKSTGNISLVSDKGGNTTDYFNIGTTNSEGNFVTDRTISTERGGGTINTFRFSEDSRGTVSSFVIPGDGRDITGFLLEPSGPSTTASGTDKRIPEGQFSLTPNEGSRFPNTFRLFNDEVPSSRAILFHGGNFNDQTEGCLLPGCGFGVGKEGQSGITKPDQIQQRAGFLRTLSSGPKLNEMNSFINVSGHENVKVNINNVMD